MSGILAQYEALRRKLVDTSLRNRMLNYRLSQRYGVETKGEVAALVYRILVEDAKKMSFEGVPDPPRGQGRLIDITDDFADADALAEARRSAEDELDAFIGYPLEEPERVDSKLTTGHTESNLKRRLTLIEREAKAVYEETGLNVLFLALGALRWYESESSEQERVAPLVFVPVKLSKTKQGHYRLEHDEGDVGDNLSLVEKAKSDFALELPRLADEPDVAQYFADVRGRVRNQQRWSVDTSFVALGFFQFAKLVAYLDLDPKQWPTDASPLEHPDVAAILGDGYGPGYDGVGEDEPIDPHRPVGQTREVFDCDSSQALAILRALGGHSMVIEGPPGTGKSQTIANLISELVAQGKSVLFVSEKMAALDVVQRRLKEARLGDACLEMHSRASKRKAFYEELKRVMGQRRMLADAHVELQALGRLRDELNEYAHACNATLEPWGITPHDAMGRASALPSEDAEDAGRSVPFEAVRGLDWPELAAKLPLIESLQRLLATTGTPAKHPFWGSSVRIVTPGLRTQAANDIEEAMGALEAASTAAHKLTQALRLMPPERLSDVRVLAECAHRAASAPPHAGVALTLQEWDASATTVATTIDQLAKAHAIQARRLTDVNGAAWETDFSAPLASYRRYGSKWWRWLSGDYRAARATLRARLTASGPKDTTGQLALLEELAEWRELVGAIRDATALMARLYGAQWQGLNSDAPALARLHEWVRDVRTEVAHSRLPHGLLAFFEASLDVGTMTDLVARATTTAEAAKAALGAALSALGYDAASAESAALAVARASLERWKANLDRLEEMRAINVQCDALKESGLGGLIPLAAEWRQAPERLAVAAQRAFFEGVLREALQQRPVLARFERTQQEERIRQFQELDRKIIEYNRARANVEHLQGLPDWSAPVGVMAGLRVNSEKKRGHKSIRWALETAGAAILRMKPVFLMSPLSVAQFLPRTGVRFDVLIFDEASQVKPEDALAPILRADQMIVVGDSMQMPPTSFFERATRDDDEEDEGLEVSRGGTESVLALARQACHGAGRCSDLRWHYRSRHSALIEASNAAFYRHRLKVFPSPSVGVWDEERQEGLRWRFDSSHVYERGTTRKNPCQATAVVEAVLEHIDANRGGSIGIAAFSQAQQEAIQDELERARARRPGVIEAFEVECPYEPIFVKNLENVQGDERDVILISVGYGPDAGGRTFMNFGPVNAEGGERRLNVLMTRARKRCEVFSSLRADDIALSATGENGVAILRRYLRFAETGELDDPQASEREAGSPFEDEVAAGLRQRGYTVDQQVGSIGFFIDLAVRHPSKPGAYALGIECDGASYHSAKSARDRDKLRQEALEARGWRLHRIWSSDWWQNQEKELSRCIVAIETAVAGAPTAHIQPGAGQGEIAFGFDAVAPQAPPVVHSAPYQKWEGPAPLGYRGRIDDVQTIIQIVLAESPVHAKVVLARFTAAHGRTRASKSMLAEFESALRWVKPEHGVQRYGEFFWATGRDAVVRDRSSLQATERKPEWVAAEELRLAMARAVEWTGGAPVEDCIRQAWKLLGFNRTSASMLEIGRAEVEFLAEQNIFVIDAGLARPHAVR